MSSVQETLLADQDWAMRTKSRQGLGIELILFRKRRMVSILILAVAFSASPAWGQCAWVLWWAVTDSRLQETRHSWKRVFAVGTEQRCELGEKEKAHLAYERIKSEGWAEEIKLLGGGTSVLARRGQASLQETFQCWPDTIDPRK